VLEAISVLKASRNGVPVTGNLTGPVSLATSLLNPNLFMRYMVREKTFTREFMDFLTEVIAGFGEAQVKAGADVISIGDPTASGEILGPELFAEFVLPSLREIIRRIKRQKAWTILHICGHNDSILSLLPSSEADAYSFDASMSIKTVKRWLGDMVLMGNVSTFLLAGGPIAAITRATRRVMSEGIDIVSPACGLGTGTPLKNIKAMTETVKKERMKYHTTSGT
jgi:[methyl-Co(III) methanol-specific corrinoid protein]:coenzyme M methyltransferase